CCSEVSISPLFRWPNSVNHFNAAYAKEYALEGMARTQVIWLKEGVIKA
ncbi:hypothetical protein ACSSMK_21950, partial [Escherichia coli]